MLTRRLRSFLLAVDVTKIMEKILNEKNAVALLERYFSALKKTGYVNGHITCRFLLYLFLIDFANTMFVFLDDKAYGNIYNLTTDIFSNAGCLMPYPTFCDGSMVAGMPYVMGFSNLRATEVLSGDKLRSTEDNNLRRI